MPHLFPADTFADGTRRIRLSPFSAHVDGTCRMGADPARSGTTRDAERHGVPGLYGADGSLLPAAPGENPQATIMALGSMVGESHRGAVVHERAVLRDPGRPPYAVIRRVRRTLCMTNDEY